MKAVYVSVLVCALLVAIPSLLFNFGDWALIAIQTGVAIFFGVLIGIEIERKNYRYPNLIQGLAGVMGGGLMGIWLTPSMTFALLGCVVGGVLGCTAHWWIKHAPLP